ncbi:glycosyltransferase [Sutcliffiella horikoshii]|uniref:CgeB family protein n=1 Tax=Sutcliffiella horikoshii TaxID=79883 RepID=UPI00203E8BE0|nr:glycosyltransferase [Sutcliffiella horikoshii]MCM3616827.1 glycosyltransferase [Sutcliffiella horikoshii]
MKWIIKNPAVANHKQLNSGDYHIGRSLTKYLERRGIHVTTDYYPKWNKKRKADVVFVIRGRFPYKTSKNSINIMWNISHPESIKLSEYKRYDIIFVASTKYAEILKRKLKKPVFPLLQCTDIEEFQETDSTLKREGFIFVGNTRGVKRECVPWSVELNIPIQVWGSGWERWIDKKYIVDTYVRNEDLGKLYSKSQVILNDHWGDMKKYGFINNRTYDALACGLPIISDYHPALEKLFPTGILFYNNKNELAECYKEIQNSYDDVKKNTECLTKKVREEFSFEQRVKEILNILKKF